MKILIDVCYSMKRVQSYEHNVNYKTETKKTMVNRDSLIPLYITHAKYIDKQNNRL